jgi:hypothetical protein
MGHRQSTPGIDIPSAQCQTATQDVARQLFAAMRIERDNKDRRQDWVLRGFRQFDAPVCVIITYDRVLDGSDDTPFDCGTHNGRYLVHRQAKLRSNSGDHVQLNRCTSR